MESDKDNMAKEPIVVSYGGNIDTILSKERLSSILSKVSLDDVPWAINLLVEKLALKKRENIVKDTTTHQWDYYELSPEIKAIMPTNRKNVSDNYKATLSEILNEKYT